MNADAHNSGSRPKRCLATKLHSKTAHTDLLKDQNAGTRRFVLKSPSHGQTIITAPKRANSRFFTDCYPISAVFAPKVDQIGPLKRPVPVRPSHHQIHN